MVNKTTEKMPFELLHGYCPRLTDGVIQLMGLNSAEGHDPTMLQGEARDRILEKQHKMAEYYNRKRSSNITFDQGEVVAMRTVPAVGEASKLQPKYRGPLQIIKVLPSDTYHVASIPIEGSRVYSTTAHVSQLKQWRLAQEEVETPTEEENPEAETTREDSLPEPCDMRKRNRRRPAHLDDYILE